VFAIMFLPIFSFFFFTHPSTTEIYTLSLHDALPICIRPAIVSRITPKDLNIVLQHPELLPAERFDLIIATNILLYYDTFEQSLRSEEHTSELQSLAYLVCRLLLEKKKII